MRRAQLARLAICTAVAAAAVPTLGVGPAHACSCGARSDAENLEASGATFTGTLLERDVPRAGEPVQSSDDPAIYTFAVDRVYKGTITNPQRVVSYVGGETCGLELEGNGPFVVFTSRRGTGSSLDDKLSAEDAALPRAYLCDGTRTAKADEKLPFGTGTAPTPIPAPEAPDSLGPTSDDEDDGGPGDGLTVGLGIAAIALIGGGIVLRGRGKRT